jgi:CARDB
MLAVPLMMLAAALPAPPATVEAAGAAPASVKVADCSVEQSSAAFYARMRTVPDADRMWLRFTVQEKHAGAYEALEAPGLSRWHKSKPGVAAFGYRQTVRGLQPGGVYRAKVSFRWYSATGELLERTRKLSRACRQFDELPNLTSAVTGSGPTKVPGVVRYLMRIANTGVAPAVHFDARLSVDGGVVDTVTIASLEPGVSRDVAILGPECTSSVSSIADPDGVIVESSEDDNAHTVNCQG